MILDEAEPHFGGSEKMATVFFRMSRSIRSRSFSRRSREISTAGSGAECGADAVVLGRSAGPAFHPPLRPRQLRSIEGAMPSSPAICVNGRPLLASRATASRLNSSVNGRRPWPIRHLPALPRSLAKVSTNSREAQAFDPFALQNAMDPEAVQAGLLDCDDGEVPSRPCSRFLLELSEPSEQAGDVASLNRMLRHLLPAARR